MPRYNILSLLSLNQNDRMKLTAIQESHGTYLIHYLCLREIKPPKPPNRPQHLPCPGKCRVPGGYSSAVVFPLRSSDLFQFYTLLPKMLTTNTTGKQLYKKNVLGNLYFPQKNLQEKWINTRLFLPCFPSSTTNVNFVQ